MGTEFAKHRGSVKRKNERDRLLFVAAAGLAFSLLVIMLVVLNYQSDASAGNPITTSSVIPPSVGTTSLYVLERPVKAGQKLGDVALKEAFWPRNNVPEGAIMDKAEVKELYAKYDLPANVPLTRDQFTNQPGQSTLPVTPGNRAVTIEVDNTSGLEGLALPGTRVDVVLTYSKDGELTSKVIVQNARVLASGGDTKTVSERPTFERTVSTAARSTTLDVSTSDALKISTARQLGRLSLMMRANEDTAVSPSTEMNQNDIGQSKEVKEKRTAITCVKGHYKIGGKEWQLNCDGSRATTEEDPNH